MSKISFFTHGNVRVTWNSNNSVQGITYNGQRLIDTLNSIVNRIQVTPQGIVIHPRLRTVLTELLDTISALPTARADLKVYLADAIFGHFLIDSVPPNSKLKIAILQELVLKEVWNWENTHETIHKGTPYFFLTREFLSQGDVPSAYVYMFNAVEEDKRNTPAIGRDFRNSPAYLTSSLIDNNQNMLYNDVVIPLRTYLQNFITQYNSKTGDNLTIQDVDTKFLQVEDFEDIKRFFVANLHEIYHLRYLNSLQLINNDFSKIKISDTLFNLCLIIDQILAHNFLTTYRPREKKMANAIYELALHLNWTDGTIDPNAGSFTGKINPHPNSGNPDAILPSFLDNIATFDNNPIDSKKTAIFIAYHLRNFGGHNIIGQDVLVTRYQDILRSVIDAFLLSIDVL